MLQNKIDLLMDQAVKDSRIKNINEKTELTIILKKILGATYIEGFRLGLKSIKDITTVVLNKLNKSDVKNENKTNNIN